MGGREKVDGEGRGERWELGTKENQQEVALRSSGDAPSPSPSRGNSHRSADDELKRRWEGEGVRHSERIPSTLKRGDMCNVQLEVMEVTTRKGTAGPMESVRGRRLLVFGGC